MSVATWITVFFSGFGGSVLTVGIPLVVQAVKDKRAAASAESVSRRKPERRTVDYFSDTVKVKKGEYVDLPKFGMTQIRVTLKDIELGQSDSPRVCLAIDGGGCLFSCGSLTEKYGTNEFLLRSRKHGQEEEWSVFKFFTHERTVHFFRVFVTHVNPHAGDVDLDFVQIHTRHELTTLFGKR